MRKAKQDKTYAESRSRIGSMSFQEIGKYIGVDNNPDDMEDQSGTASNPGDGEEDRDYDKMVKVTGNRN